MPDIAYTFGKLASEQQSSAGGKGSTLSRLYQAGYPVPAGLVILHTAFRGDGILPDAWSQVQTCLTRLRSGDPNAVFAIRSSAVAEDSALASFAGEFETVLNVRSDEEIRAAIDTVRQSRHSERVKAYSQAQGVSVVHEMAVIVQCLVKADISGVLFTADPVTSSRERMVGNFVYGLGDKLVSGEVESVSFSIDRPKRSYNGPAELKRFSRKLYKLASRLEKDLGYPQDIEWAISRGKVYILQSRPITTMIGFNPITGEFNDSLTGDFTWSCVNVGEAMPTVMTPFTWSCFRYGFNIFNIVPGHEMVGNIGGRIYQNGEVMMTMLKALRQDTTSLVKELSGVRKEYVDELEQYLAPLPDISFFSILPGTIRLFRRILAAGKNLDGFIKGNPDWCRTKWQQIQAIQDKEELASLYVQMLQTYVTETYWRLYATFMNYGRVTGKLRNKLVEMVGTDDTDILLSNTSRDDELLPSLGPLVGMSKLARGEMSREDYLEQWGHRGPLEAR